MGERNLEIRNGDAVRRVAFDKDGVYAENAELLLREVRPSDKENFFDIYRAKDAEKKFFAESEILEYLWNSFWDEDILYTMIIRKADGAFCGFCGLQYFTTNEVPELAIELVKECQHQGIGTAVLPMLMKHFADVTGSGEFISRVSHVNIASRRLMEKIGGRMDGIIKLPGVTEEIARLLEEDDSPQPEWVEKLAAELGIPARRLRSHALVFRFFV